MDLPSSFLHPCLSSSQFTQEGSTSCTWCLQSWWLPQDNIYTAWAILNCVNCIMILSHPALPIIHIYIHLSPQDNIYTTQANLDHVNCIMIPSHPRSPIIHIYICSFPQDNIYTTQANLDHVDCIMIPSHPVSPIIHIYICSPPQDNIYTARAILDCIDCIMILSHPTLSVIHIHIHLSSAPEAEVIRLTRVKECMNFLPKPDAPSFRNTLYM